MDNRRLWEMTVDGGEESVQLSEIGGADTVSLSNEAAVYFWYPPNAGNVLLYGFSENDTLLVSENYSTISSANNSIILTSGSTSVTLIDAQEKEFNFSIGSGDLPTDFVENNLTYDVTLTGGESQELFSYSGTNTTLVKDFSTGMSSISDVIFLMGGELLNVKRNAQIVTLNMTNGNYFSIETRTTTNNEVILYSTDGTNFLGAEIADDSATDLIYYNGANYFQLSQTGNLIVTDSENNNIWLDGSAGKIFSNITNIDASSSSGENIFAGDSNSNQIISGIGNSSSWGGAGNISDTLIGGSGTDIFWFGKNDGADIISNASSDDIVNLYDISLPEIFSAEVSENKISATFLSGGSLELNFIDTFSPKINLSDGTSWKYDSNFGNWQSA